MACCVAVSMGALSSPRRASRLRCEKLASCAWRSSARCCSRQAARLRSASITASSSAAFALLAVGQLHVEFFEARLGGHAAFVQVGSVARRSRPVRRRAVRCGRGSVGQWRQAQGLDLQLVRAGLRFGGFAARGHEALRGVGVGGLGAHQGRARFFGDQCLRAQLFSRFSISCARASMPDCSESGA